MEHWTENMNCRQTDKKSQNYKICNETKCLRRKVLTSNIEWKTCNQFFNSVDLLV
jgi:hypothetical protein